MELAAQKRYVVKIVLLSFSIVCLPMVEIVAMDFYVVCESVS